MSKGFELIITDASSTLALAKMRRLELLMEVYGEVPLAPAVKTQILDQGMAVTEIL